MDWNSTALVWTSSNAPREGASFANPDWGSLVCGRSPNGGLISRRMWADPRLLAISAAFPSFGCLATSRPSLPLASVDARTSWVGDGLAQPSFQPPGVR